MSLTGLRYSRSQNNGGRYILLPRLFRLLEYREVLKTRSACPDFGQILGQIFDQVLARIFGIRPERGRDGRTGGRTGRTDGTDGRADGRDGQTEYSFAVLLGRTEYSFAVLLGRRNTVLQYYWDGEIQFCSTTGTEK